MRQLELFSQRWRGGRPTWKHRHQGGFDSRRYAVGKIPTGKAFVVEHHYAGSIPPTVHHFGLFEGSELVGVALLTNPMNNLALTNVFPDLLPCQESFELGRFVLLDRVPSNGESWFWARCRELAAADGIQGIVAFSDPAPRRVAGVLTFRGHWGCAYQGGGAMYLGRSTARWLELRADGTVLNERTQQKARSGEKGHAYAAAQVQSARESGTVKVWHHGNHRYAWVLGKGSVRVAMPEQRYPKALDPELVAA